MTHDLALTEREVPDDVRTYARTVVLGMADRHLAAVRRIPYRIPSEDFFWGATSEVEPQAP